MSNMIINEEVDIHKLPAVDLMHKLTDDTEITIGDLHANTMKLMFMLVKHGIAKNVNVTDYNRLLELYNTPTEQLTKRHLKEFNAILDKIDFQSDATIRLIGDELADRGNNDYFTLKVLEKLNEHKVPVEILISNHGVEFIEAYEKQNDFRPPRLFYGGHGRSMDNLQILLEKGIVSRTEIIDLANKAYKPTLRAISYTLAEDNSEITIHSHAAIGLNTIQRLAAKLAVQYQDTTPADLAKTIDNINSKFQEHVQNNTVHTLYSAEEMKLAYTTGNFDFNDPFVFIMWNRYYNQGDKKFLHRPKSHNGYKVNFSHGHDPNDPGEENVYNLDNVLGKAVGYNKGLYTVLYSRNSKKAPVNHVNKKVSHDSNNNTDSKKEETDLIQVSTGKSNTASVPTVQPAPIGQSANNQIHTKYTLGSFFSLFKQNNSTHDSNNNNNKSNKKSSWSSWSDSSGNAKMHLPTELLKAQEHSYCIYMMGAPKSGKTSLVDRFVESPHENKPSTSTASQVEKNREMTLNGDLYILKFVDYTPGPFDKMPSYRNMDGIVLIIDMTSPDAEAIVKGYLEDIKRYGTPEKQYIMLVGNKCDAGKLSINPESILSFARSTYQFNIGYMEVSAKEGINTQEALKQLIKGIDMMKAKLNHSSVVPRF